ncbi:MAG TPA: crosslink repair DNA glycosylase YcaQ family protein [Capillimicrobium sp.]
MPATLVSVARTWTVQDSPPGAAALALSARVPGLEREAVDRALLDERTLVAVYNPRTATSIIPSDELGLFGAALDPLDPLDLPPVLRNAVSAGADAAEALDLATAAVADALADGPLSRDDLHEQLRGRLPAALLPWCDGCQSHHARRGLLVVAGLRGAMCLAGRAGRQVRFARPEDWLGDAPARPAREDGLRALAERYLAAFGPATAAPLADWAGIARGHARAALAALGDAPPPAGPPPLEGLRLLGAGDPVLQTRDRERLVPDAALRKRGWAPSGAPGVVLLDGAVAGLWRARKQGRRLTITVEPVAGRLDPGALDAEAQRVAAMRGAAGAEVVCSG